jgi:predicted GIY-YIG superfamily endonuclease
MAKAKTDRTHHVYLITIKDTGLQYVGVTCRFNRRMYDHKRSRSLIGNAIRSCVSVDYKIVYSTKSRVLAYHVEKYMIDILNTLTPSGLNAAHGGAGGQIDCGRDGCKLNIPNIVRMFGAGHTIKSLAERNNCSTKTITNRLKRSKNYKPTKAGRRWLKPDDAHLIYKDRCDGWYISELMEKYNLCRDTIYRRIKEYEHRDIVEVGGAA